LSHNDPLESQIQEFGQEIIRYVDQTKQSVFTREFYNSWLLDWSMKNPAFKTSLFRFIDVLPVLEDDLELVSHAREYFSQVSDSLPAGLKAGLYLNPGKLSSAIAAPLIRRQVETVASSFVSGENVEQAMPKLSGLLDKQRAFITCFLGDAVLSKQESLQYLEKYRNLIKTLSLEMNKRASFLDSVGEHHGLKYRSHVSVKLSTLYSQARPLNHSRSVSTLTDRFIELALAAKEYKSALCIDMEEAHFTPVALETFYNVLSQPDLKGWDGLGLVLQAYSKRTEKDLEQIIAFSKMNNQPVSVRLVKGAYWDYETMLAAQHDWPNPLFLSKQSTDANFEKLAMLLLDNTELVFPAFGSHNIRSLSTVAAYAEENGIGKNRFEYQFLFGMAEPIKEAFASQGFLTRDYVPVGKLIPGMGYLVRRLLENTSNEGFLRQKFHADETPEQLLAKPNFSEPVQKQEKDDFSNEAPLDFSIEANRKSIAKELDTLLGNLEKRKEFIRPVINGKSLKSREIVKVKCPSDITLTTGEIHLASSTVVDDAIKSLKRGFESWSIQSPGYRIESLQRLAKLISQNREKLIARLVIEIGKNVEEADGEVTEAVDFINYYCDQAKRMYSTNLVISLPGEDNRLVYQPRGVTAVIGPWNFPLAIPCGMMTAALVTGNSVLLKPAEQASIVANELVSLALEAGVPKSALAFIPGLGEEIGDSLVRHPLVETIAFTGSKAVGLRINQLAASSPSASQTHVKRVIAEMGGKNAIIVDSDADLDQAVLGVLKSCFGFQGQKCSACSRAILVGSSTRKDFLSRLIQALDSLEAGPAWEPDKMLGPLVNKEHLENVKRLIEEGKRSAEVLYEYPHIPFCEKGYFARPIIFGNVSGKDSLWNKEVFGPVLVVRESENFAHALELANDSIFGLTGAVYSRNPGNLSLAREKFQAGNLYINRKSTGALVGRQPFGGAKMSGLGMKAGGPDYLKGFVNPQCVTENTFRSGFLPDLA